MRCEWSDLLAVHCAHCLGQLNRSREVIES
jgi:hypothetical protein